MMTVACVASSVHELVQRAGYRPAIASVVRTVLGGIAATGSVVLSELLRPQVDKEGLHAAEERLSSALRGNADLDRLPDVYLAMVAPAAAGLRYRTLDGSDLSKPAGRAFESLDVVRDGSCKPRDRVVVGSTGVRRSQPIPGPSPQPGPGVPSQAQQSKSATKADPPRRGVERVKVPSPPAIKKLGYWTVQIEAGDGTGNHVPLYQNVYSTQDPSYQALGQNAWTRTAQLGVERVLKYVGPGGIWLMDRGYDDVAWMTWMHAHVEQSVIRVKGNRLVRPGTREGTAMNVTRFAATLTPRHVTPTRYVHKSTHEARCLSIPFTWAPIWVDGVAHPLYLIVGHTGRKRPLLLVTDRRPERPEEAGALIQAYFERWGNEELTRACKQLTGLENIRVRSLRAIRRLTWLAMIAVGLQARTLLTRPRLRRAVLDRAKEFIKDVRFVLYRTWRVVQGDLQRALASRPHLFA